MLSSDDTDDGNRLIAKNNGKMGISSTSPWGVFSIESSSIATSTSPIFVISDQGTTSPFFYVSAINGGIGIGTTSPLATTTISGHLQFGGKRPFVSSCGTAPSIVGNDNAGKVTIGTGVVSSCTLTFENIWTNAPACFANDETGILLTRAVSTQTTLTLSVSTDFAGAVVSYYCTGYE